MIRKTTGCFQQGAKVICLSFPPRQGQAKRPCARHCLRGCPSWSIRCLIQPENPRLDEKEGVDYHFIDKEEFENGIKNKAWAEWAKVHGNYYGTAVNALDQAMNTGKSLLLDIDVQGTIQILAHYPDAVTVFIMAPSMQILKERLEKRSGDSQATIHKRLENAKKEIAQKGTYRYIVINDQLSRAIDELYSIILDCLQDNGKKWEQNGP